MRAHIAVLLLVLVATSCLSAPRLSPLAKAWNAQAMPVSRESPTLLADSLAEGTQGAPLPLGAVTEFRTIDPTVGREDSVRALYRFRLTPSVTGYVIRFPSTEGPYLALVSYHRSSGVWSRPILLAQTFGDAGYFWEGRSWLVDLNGDGYTEVVSRWHSTDYDLDNDTLPPRITDSMAVIQDSAGSLSIHPIPADDPLWSRFALPARR
jgi:hypothetical protein